ncbi:hypothetical protein AQUCO_04000123v1 [Aquilegia coerulea]|uniref:HVA22-like protein n=1 Tax=Aquilegia coerulea TaxID=218851 RepID=A0A2G5CRD6_AQUCA|nr:hypothetical protein AQUCO_04000123v1 [Aquilegia coerulea]
MDRFWTFMSQLHALAGPLVMLMYPLYASVMAMESTSKVDDEQWIPIWYDIKLAMVAWLVLPQFRGAAFVYEKFVREKLRQYGGKYVKNQSPIAKNKFVDFITPHKKGDHE